MISAEKIQKMFDTPKDHTPIVTLVGSTDQQNFKVFWEKAGLEDVMDDMDANASKAGMPQSPVFITIVAGKDGHMHAQINIPLQQWSAGLHVDDYIEDTNNVQRITDWIAGFMETFSANGSVHAVDLRDGKTVFGSDTSRVEDMVRALSPKKEKSELMSDSLSIGSVDDILNGQMSMEEIKDVEKPDVTLDKAEAALKASSVIEAAAQKAPPVVVKLVKEVNDKDDKKVQEEILEKFGEKALKDLLARTKRPLLVQLKPKSKKA